jgi:hypothetical protein
VQSFAFDKTPEINPQHHRLGGGFVSRQRRLNIICGHSPFNQRFGKPQVHATQN